MANPDKKEFHAWHDKMPGSHHKLIVTGKITVPTTGWKAKLVEAVPQGTNHAILILNVEKTKPGGAAGNVVSHIEVRFQKEGGDEYDQVTIRGDGDEFTIDVGDAQ